MRQVRSHRGQSLKQVVSEKYRDKLKRKSSFTDWMESKRWERRAQEREINPSMLSKSKVLDE